MPLRLFHVGFSFIDPDFWKSTNLSQFFANPDDRIVDQLNDANVLVIGNSVKDNEISIINNFAGIRLMYIGEPIGKFPFTRISDEFFFKGLYNFAIGSISNKPQKWIKYPSYNGISDRIKTTNALVLAANLVEKRACTLINRHDTGNTRLPILRELTSQGMHVVCPGLLANNCSNNELNRIGSVEYIRKFVFNICSENFSNCQPGYVTEKLVNCCLAGAIPIYFGSLDEIDSQVFNKERILFLTHENTREIADKVLEMCATPELLEAFYRQPVFLDTAEEAIVKIDSNIRGFFKAMSDSFKPRSMQNLIF
jgi:hypothetical protein